MQSDIYSLKCGFNQCGSRNDYHTQNFVIKCWKYLTTNLCGEDVISCSILTTGCLNHTPESYVFIFRPHSHVCGYFWIRNFFLLDTASVTLRAEFPSIFLEKSKIEGDSARRVSNGGMIMRVNEKPVWPTGNWTDSSIFSDERRIRESRSRSQSPSSSRFVQEDRRRLCSQGK